MSGVISGKVGLTRNGADISDPNPLPVSIISGNSVFVGGAIKIASASFTRPADTNAYVSGDIIANSVTAGSVTPMVLAVARLADATFSIPRVRLSISDTAWAGATVRVHLFKNSPTTAAGDNVAFSGAVNGIAAVHLGYVDVYLDETFSDGVKGEGVPNAGSAISGDPSSGTVNIFAILETRSAVNPASGSTFTVAAEVLQN